VTRRDAQEVGEQLGSLEHQVLLEVSFGERSRLNRILRTWSWLGLAGGIPPNIAMSTSHEVMCMFINRSGGFGLGECDLRVLADPGVDRCLETVERKIEELAGLLFCCTYFEAIQELDNV
jgi:hypothetical protein